jgi:hypothetical protein
MGAVALCGASGIGKSTLVGLMMARGFPVLDDNIAALSFAAADAVHVMPGLGSIRLYADSLSWLDYDATGLTPLRGQPSKYIMPLPPQLCAQSAAPLKKIFILRRGDSYAITPLRADEKIPALQAHSFMGRLAPGLGRLSSLFQHWLTLCKRVPMAYLNIPAAVAPTQFADELAQRWQQADFD